MVNLTETSKLDNASSSNNSFSNLFNLSRPINLFEDKFEKTKNLILKSNTQSSLFEFIEPFESSHAKANTIGKQISNKLNSNRAKPYTLSKPDKQNEKPVIESSSNSNYHQTAILARLSSISSTFKSIFVRPKNNKQIDLDSIKLKSSLKNQPATGDFKIKLFSTSDNDQTSSALNQKIEKIISKNIDTYSVKNSNSSNSSVVSTLSTTSNLTSDSFLNTATAKVTTVKSGQVLSKWTCMICLSKHKMDVKVCSICGSLKHDQKVSIKQTNANTLKTIHNQTNSNYLKTWTCSYCNYANDSLKIVCMNCRSSKQIKKDDQVYQSVQLKRSRKQDTDKLNTSNEENEFEHNQTSKKSKQDKDLISEKKNEKPCMCKCNQESILNEKNHQSQSNLKQQSAIMSTTLTTSATNNNKASSLGVFENQTADNLVTPTKPSNFYNTCTSKPLIAGTKWTCNVCLVSNDEDKNVCVCCTSTREIVKQDKKNDKWKCQVCLVSNDSDKESCVCCTTSRNNTNANTNTDNTKTKFSELVAAAGSITNQLGLTSSVNENISFGLKSADQASNKPICFTSSFGLVNENSKSVGFCHSANKPSDNFQNENRPVQFGTTNQTKVVSFNITNNSDRQNCLSNETPKKLNKLNEQAFDSDSRGESTVIQNDNNQLSFNTLKTNNFSFLTKSDRDKEENKSPITPFQNSNTQTNNLISFGSNQSTSTNTTAASSSLFATSTNQNLQTNATSSTTGGLFGTNKIQTGPSFSFGSTETPQQSSSLFGQNQPKSTFSFTNLDKPFDHTPTQDTQANSLFGSSTSTDSKATFGSQTSVAKQTPNLFSSICSSESKPSAFSFGNNEASNGLFANTLNTNQTTQENKPAFLFANTNAQTPKTASLFTFGGSNSNQSLFATPSNDSKASFCFDNTQQVKPANTNGPTFVSSSTNESTKPAFSFGNSEPSKSSFQFANSATATTKTETKPSEQSFVFGGQSQNQKTNETTAPAFNFGSSNANFNFGTTTNSFGTCSTPSTKSTFGTSVAVVAPTTPKTTMTPFAFGAGNGTGLNQQNNVDSPSLSQVLSAQTTPSTRVIKKPTRRLKK